MQQKKRAPPDYILKKYSQADGIIFKMHAHNRWRQKERLRSLPIQSDRNSTFISLLRSRSGRSHDGFHNRRCSAHGRIGERDAKW